MVPELELEEDSVEAVVADFMETDLSALGAFDVVFYLGVLYHMQHPLLDGGPQELPAAVAALSRPQKSNVTH